MDGGKVVFNSIQIHYPILITEYVRAVEFRNCHFNYDFSFEKDTICYFLEFHKCIFSEEKIYNFSHVKFVILSFLECEFKSFFDLSNCVFGRENEEYINGFGDFNLKSCIFFQSVGFNNCLFYGNANFDKLIFKVSTTENTPFRQQIFWIDFYDSTEVIQFYNVKFYQSVYFQRCNFYCHVIFIKTIFGAKHILQNEDNSWEINYYNKRESESTILFFDCLFNEIVNFNDSIFKVSARFDNLEFKKMLKFEDFVALKHFKFEQTIFIKATFFLNSIFYENLFFTNTTFYENLVLRSVIFKKGIDLSRALIIGNISIINFSINFRSFSTFEKKKKINWIEYNVNKDYLDRNKKVIDKFIKENDREISLEEIISYRMNEIPLQNKVETFRILRKNFIDINRIDKTLEFGILEKESLKKLFEKELINGKNIFSNFLNWLIIFMNKYSNFYGTSYFRGIIFTGIIGLFFFILTISNTKKFYHDEWFSDTLVLEKAFKYYFIFLLPTHDYEYLNELIPNTFSYLFDFMGRIFVGYGIYQTIQAFRKFR